ncbi:MAG: double-strand break repair protein AddB, partial [Hyphomicrobiaceae bacterium]|nr:double-strand break repair protein AddB [Hyphomicrobiaceae bacterium]
MEGPRPTLRLASLRAGADFFDQLGDLWLDGGLDPAIPAPGDDPFALIDTTFLVPTRRAARLLGACLGAKLEARGLGGLLPVIHPIGDVEDRLDPADEDGGLHALRPAGRIEQRLLLARLIQSASAAIRSALAATDPSVQPVFSGRIADCIRLAGDLQRLMEEVETAEGDFAGLDALVPEALAAYWQISRQLVAIAAEAHPALLDERGLISTARLRNQRLAHEAERHRTRPAGVTIAAGSTGSIPATARLLAAIAAAPQGIVVLPGFDETLAPEARAALLEAGDEAAAHPQYGLQSLLNRLGAEPADVRMLGPEDRLASPRRRIVTHAFLPAAHHQPAPALDPGEAAAFDGLELIEAENEADEARAIAARLRLAIGEETLPAILVTPDRALARRVAAELDRYGIAADDSAGTPLMQTPEGILAALAARAVAEGFTPTLLLSLLKHPLAAFGLERAECRRRARLLERAALRGPAPAAGLEGLRAALSAHRRQRAEKARIAVLAKGLDATDDADIDDLIERIAEAFGPLSDQAFTERPLGETVLLLSETLCRISRGPDGEARILAGEAGEALAGLFSAIAASPDAGLAVAPRDLDPVLAALAAGLAVRPSRPADPRVQILGPLEARLLPASLTLLAGLEEGVWPAAATTDPFVSRAMRRALKLEPPERQIGLAAHDVEQVLCRQNVVLARARRSASAPLVPSRWWLRLEAALPEGVLKAARARGDAVLAAARDLDAAPG